MYLVNIVLLYRNIVIELFTQTVYDKTMFSRYARLAN